MPFATMHWSSNEQNSLAKVIEKHCHFCQGGESHNGYEEGILLLGKKRHFQKLHSETTIYVTSAKNWKHLQSEATPSENVNAIQNSTIIALILLLLNKDASLDTYQTFGTRRHSKHKWLNLPKDYRNHFLPIGVIYATLAFHSFSSFQSPFKRKLI